MFTPVVDLDGMSIPLPLVFRDVDVPSEFGIQVPRERWIVIHTGVFLIHKLDLVESLAIHSRIQ